jgi:hypothetical protein
VGRKYTKQQFLAGFRRFLSDSEHPPSIAKLSAILRSMFRTERRQLSVWDRDYQIIDFCMDMLGPDFVSDEVKSIVGHPQSVKWAALVSKKQWVKDYRRAKKQLWEAAVKRWEESGPPIFRFLRGPEQRKWDLIGAPHFILGDMNITPARNTELSRVPYHVVDGYIPPMLPVTEVVL